MTRQERGASRAGDAAEGEGVLPGRVVLAILTAVSGETRATGGRGQGTGDEVREHVGMPYRRSPRPLLLTHTFTNWGLYIKTCGMVWCLRSAT